MPSDKQRARAEARAAKAAADAKLERRAANPPSSPATDGPNVEEGAPHFVCVQALLALALKVFPVRKFCHKPWT